MIDYPDKPGVPDNPGSPGTPGRHGIRVADGNDLEGVVAVGKAVLRSQAELGREPELVELLIAKFWTPEANSDAIRAGRTLVAEADGQVVGILSYGLNDGQPVIWKVYVLPDHVGHGHGRALLEAFARKVSFDHTHVSMPVEEGNEVGIRFAERMGFSEQRREGQSGMPDLIWFVRDMPRNEV